MSDDNSGEAKELVAGRLPPDLYQRFEAYREDRGGIDKTTALRRLLRAGLDAAEGDGENDRGDPRAAAAATVGGAAYAVVAGLTGPSLPTVAVASLFIAATVTYTAVPPVRNRLR